MWGSFASDVSWQVLQWTSATVAEPLYEISPSAKVELVESLGGEVVGALFVIELTFLNGRDKLPGADVHALIAY